MPGITMNPDGSYTEDTRDIFGRGAVTTYPASRWSSKTDLETQYAALYARGQKIQAALDAVASRGAVDTALGFTSWGSLDAAYTRHLDLMYNTQADLINGFEWTLSRNLGEQRTALQESHLQAVNKLQSTPGMEPPPGRESEAPTGLSWTTKALIAGAAVLAAVLILR